MAAGGKPKDPRLDEALLLRELADSRREVRNLTVMGMRPDVSADQREIIHNLERSARAQVKMGIKALQYCREQQRGRQRHIPVHTAQIITPAAESLRNALD